MNPEAYDAYLKGRYFFNRPSDENLSKAITQFEEAIKLDPNFAPAFSGLSDAYLWAGFNEGVLHRLGGGAAGRGPRRKRRSDWTTLPPRRMPLLPCTRPGTNTIGPEPRANFAGPSPQSELRIRPRPVRPGCSRSRAGSTNRWPRAGARRSSTRCLRKSPSTLSSRSPGRASTRRRRSSPGGLRISIRPSSFLRSWTGGSTFRRGKSATPFRNSRKPGRWSRPRSWPHGSGTRTGLRAIESARWRRSRS